MVTDWEQLVGKTIEGTHHGHEGVVLLLGLEFAVIRAEEGYPNESGYPVLAKRDNEDALYAGVLAGATGARQLLDEAKLQHDQEREKQERRRLAYLQEKYKTVPTGRFPSDHELRSGPTERTELTRKVKEILSQGFPEGDVHSELAREIFGADFTSEQRHKIKEITFRTLYLGVLDALD